MQAKENNKHCTRSLIWRLLIKEHVRQGTLKRAAHKQSYKQLHKDPYVELHKEPYKEQQLESRLDSQVVNSVLDPT